VSGASWTIGRYVVESLALNGIDTVFGIPGVHNIELYRGLQPGGVRHVLARHEQNAVFAADGFARASGRPAAAFVISGPGLTNALTAIAQAWSDSVPVLVIASTPVRASLGRHWGVLHELEDQRALVASICAFAGSARSHADVREQLRAALAALRAPRARPAYVDIPLDLLAESTPLRPEHFAPAAAAPQLPPLPPQAILARVQQLLEQAQRPLVIAGGGARHAGAALLRLLEAVDGYLVTTVAGKGVIPESHPANLGAGLPFEPIQAQFAAADLIIAAGTELSETDVYTTTRLPRTGQLVRIDVDPRKLTDHYGAEVAVAGDAARVLEALAAAAAARPRRGWRSAAGPAALWRARIEQEFSPGTRARLAALRALRAAVPEDGAVFSDMTQIAYLGNYAFAAERPGVWFHPSGYGTLGFAVPAAIGARIAQPERAVVALAGDFGFQFTQQELLNAVEMELCLPVVVWNNEALGQIRHDMRAAGIEPVGVTGRNPDFLALAAACGAAGVRVHNAEELTGELRTALARPGPTLIEAVAGSFTPAAL
jgi:thiamine pyrophosphate-dependent acetolactate synthase large subunit-like protein